MSPEEARGRETVEHGYRRRKSAAKQPIGRCFKAPDGASAAPGAAGEIDQFASAPRPWGAGFGAAAGSHIMAYPEELDLSQTGSASPPSPVEWLFPLPDDAAATARNALAEELAQQQAALAAAGRRLAAQMAVTRILAQAESL